MTTLAERFHSKYERGKPDACWEWQASKQGEYGQIYDRRVNRPVKAQRIAWELANGHPGDLHVLHKCDNPPCVNPDHLFLGTHDDNMVDASVKGRFDGREWNGIIPPPQIGEDAAVAKLTEDAVRRIRSLYDDGSMSQYELARMFGVTRPNIGYIVRRKTWRHI